MNFNTEQAQKNRKVKKTKSEYTQKDLHIRLIALLIRRGFGGHNTLHYLTKVENMGFVDAVLHLSGSTAPALQSDIESKPRDPPPKLPFILPDANRNNDRVYA